MDWFEAVEIVEPHILRISTPRGFGTAFLIAREPVFAAATAAHVIDQAHYWEEPIRLHHHQSGKSVLTRARQRAVLVDPAQDTAALVFDPGDIPLPVATLTLAPQDKFLKVGNQIGWLGFPSLAGLKLCFFGGQVSAWLPEVSAYLVDGVAINGVSGGPAFFMNGSTVVVMGFVSEYVPNRATGEVLPGVAMVRPVFQIHKWVAMFDSLDKAKAGETPPGSLAPTAGPEASGQRVDPDASVCPGT